MIGLYMLLVALFMLAIGFPVAFTFGAVAVFFGFYYGFYEAMQNDEPMSMGWEYGEMMFAMMPHRIWDIMNNKLLMAIPLFILMGLILQRTRMAERLLESMGVLFGSVRGGVAISTVVVGSMLAASTGVVGASVVAMGIISLPVMMKYNYNKSLATGTICAAGTLGQIIPPSIVLIILGDVFNQPVGDLFKAALWPGLFLIVMYVLYIAFIAWLKPELAPAIKQDTGVPLAKQIKDALMAIIPPLLLIVAVLGSIFGGYATATESAAVGVIGALLLGLFYHFLGHIKGQDYGQVSWSMLIDSSRETVKITAMVFAILVGATAFSMVFTYTGADSIVEDFLTSLPGDKMGFILLTMLIILVLGFFIDFVEISYIVVPILVPVAEALGINPIWFAILIAMNLQSSFLTPPFGFSLFYLKGVAPKSVTSVDIYKGVIPFIMIQVFVLLLLVFSPEFFGMSSS